MIFSSDRDLNDGDFYRVATAEGSSVERLSYASHPDITGIATGLRTACFFDVSDDGSRLAFMGKMAGGEVGVFVMDTATQTIERVDTGAYGNATGFSLAGDGSRLVFTSTETVAEDTPEEELVLRLVAVELDAPATVAVIREQSLEDSFSAENSLGITSSGALALARDGSAIATMMNNVSGPEETLFTTLVVMRFDGTDIRPVVLSDEDLTTYGPGGLTF